MAGDDVSVPAVAYRHVGVGPYTVVRPMGTRHVGRRWHLSQRSAGVPDAEITTFGCVHPSG
jgi:hypothetical protein